MNRNNKKKGSKFAAIPGLIFLVIMLVMSNVDEPEIAIAVVAMLVVVAVVFATVSSVVKSAAAKKAPQTRPVQTRMPAFEKTPAAARRSTHRDEAEEAVHCAHSRGKEKYLEQLDSFLANGIIDKAEYKLMKERYSKLEIEDDYH